MAMGGGYLVSRNLLLWSLVHDIAAVRVNPPPQSYGPQVVNQLMFTHG